MPRRRLVLRAARRPAAPPLWWLLEPLAVMTSVVVLGAALAGAIEVLRRLGALVGWVIG